MRTRGDLIPRPYDLQNFLFLTETFFFRCFIFCLHNILIDQKNLIATIVDSVEKLTIVHIPDIAVHIANLKNIRFHYQLMYHRNQK